MHSIALMVSDREAQHELAVQLGPHVTITACVARSDLLAVIVREPIAVVITELTDLHGVSAAPFIRSVRLVKPNLPIVGVVHRSLRDLHEIAPAARVGLTDFTILGHENPWNVIRSMCEVTSRERTEAAVAALLKPIVPPDAWPLIEQFIAGANRCNNVSQLCRSLGVSPRNLARTLDRIGLPASHAVLSWIRLIAAAHLLELRELTVGQIGRGLLFSSPSQFRKTLHRIVGLHTVELQRPGTVTRLVAQFAACFATPRCVSRSETEATKCIVDPRRDRPYATELADGERAIHDCTRAADWSGRRELRNEIAS